MYAAKTLLITGLWCSVCGIYILQDAPRIRKLRLQLHHRLPGLRRRPAAGRVQVLGPVALVQQDAPVEVLPAAPLEQLKVSFDRVRSSCDHAPVRTGGKTGACPERRKIVSRRHKIREGKGREERSKKREHQREKENQKKRSREGSRFKHAVRWCVRLRGKERTQQGAARKQTAAKLLAAHVGAEYAVLLQTGTGVPR